MHETSDLIPLEQVKNELRQLCGQGRTGTLYLRNEQKRMAVIVIHKGDVIDALFGLVRGVDALAQIKGFSRAKLTFKEGYLRSKPENAWGLPPTEDVFRMLGMALDKDALRKIGKKVLVVEDSNTTRKAIVRMLKEEGYRVAEASDGFQALAQLSELKPDLILLDIIMPGIDGYKVLHALKKAEEMKDIPVIMLTSRDKLFDKVRGKMSGSDEYLTKPFKREQLLEKVNLYLRH